MEENNTTIKNNEHKEDAIESSLRGVSQNILAAIFGLLPLFFLPITFAPFDHTKTLFVIVGVLLAVIFFSLSVLRSGVLKISAPLALAGLWGVAGTAVVSALLSGDIRDSLIGDMFGVNTAMFLVLLAVVSTVVAMMGQSKASVMRLYLLLTVSAGVLTIFHISRLFLGADFLTMKVFTSVVSSPVGSWNDTGLLFGLIILLSLVAYEQLPLTKWGRVLFAGAIVTSLLMLAVINFTSVWVVLALVSLIVLMYSLTKDRFAGATLGKEDNQVSLQSIFLSAAVFIMSLVFIIGGSTMGTWVSNLTNISYVEVRPSFEATLDIAREVYKENAFVGVGPNRFADAWRSYKDPSINQTVFWATDFNSGNGYIPSFFITTGVFGAIAWIIFLALFLKAGFRMLFQAQTGDKFWYFIASSSFIAAVYLWGMSFFYVPGPTILLLAGIFTSIVFASYVSTVPVKTFTLSVIKDKRSGIILIGLVMIIIVAASSALYYVGRHYSAVYTFSSAINSITDGTTIEGVEKQIASAYETSRNDIYALQIAQYQIAKMNTLLNIQEPTTEQQQQFQQAATNGINAAQLAIEADNTNPVNHAVLGNIYSILAAAGIEGASDRALASYNQASQLDPVNPIYGLLEARLYSRVGNIEQARESVLSAIAMKPNYTDALALLTQLDIAAGNVEDAITATAAMVSLEPNNPARAYQLGVLYASNGDNGRAIQAFERAVRLDPNYANARYFLALAYAEVDRIEDAIAQMEVVRDLNPGNANVQELINQLQSGESISPVAEVTETVEEPEGVVEENGDVTTTADVDTDLISNVNPTPNTEEVTEENTDTVLEEETVTE